MITPAPAPSASSTFTPPMPAWDGTGSPPGYSDITPPGQSHVHGNIYHKSVGDLGAFISGPHPADGTFKAAGKLGSQTKWPIQTHSTPQAAHAYAEAWLHGTPATSNTSSSAATSPVLPVAVPPAPSPVPAPTAAKYVTVPKGGAMVKTPLTDAPLDPASLSTAKADYNLSSKAETTLKEAVASGKIKTQGDLAQTLAMTHAVNQGSGYGSLTGFSMDKALGHGTVAKMKAAAEADPTSEAATHVENLAGTNILSPAKQKAADADAAFQSQSGDDLMHQKVGGQAGSNPGGFYKTKSGDDVYAKLHADPQQAHSEHAANQIYRALGLSAPVSTVATNGAGKTVYGSKLIDNDGTLGKGPLTQKIARDALRGHAADILLGNHDVTGLGLDNMVSSGGKVSRIDNGGALLYRAQGAKKTAAETGKIDAWDGFSNPAQNSDYAKLFAKSGYKDAAHLPGITAQIADIQALEKKHGGWDGFLAAHAPGMDAATRAATAAMLTKRTALLGQKRLDLLDTQGGSLEALAGKTHVAGGESKASSQWGNDPFSKYAKKVDGMSPAQSSPHFQKLYAAHPHVYGDLTSPISKWTGSSSGHAWQDQWPAALDGKTHAGALKVQEALKTRRARWQALSDAHGVPFPETFHLHRGTGDSQGTILPHIISAWRNEDEGYMHVASHPAASWSLSKNAAKGFYGSTNGAMYETHVPFSQTLADKYVDDQSFLHSFPSEHEVVVGGQKNSVIVPKSGVTAKYKGKEYGYADRQKLFDEWEKDHGSLPDAKHFGIDVAAHQKKVGAKVQLKERFPMAHETTAQDTEDAQPPDYKSMTGAEYMKQLQKETAAFQAPLHAAGVTPAPPDGTVEPLGSFAEARAQQAAEKAAKQDSR